MTNGSWMNGMDAQDRQWFLHGEFTGIALDEPRRPVSKFWRVFWIAAFIIMSCCALVAANY